MSVKLNLIGQKFARLTIIYEGERVGKRQERSSVCKCECGKTITARNHDITSGNTKSCGCLRIEHGHSIHTTEGNSTKTYKCWRGILGRCYNKKTPNYQNYGGRGITVCDRWRHSFKNFLEDMGESPQRMSLDRIDNNLGYSKENCRWATQSQQMRNTRRNVILTVNGVTACLKDLCAHFGKDYRNTRNRLELGWSIEDALFKPPMLNQWG